MKILIDTNIILNYITGREDKYSEESEQIMFKCTQSEIDGYVAFHSLSTIWYVTRKFPDELRREWLRQICEVLTISWADNNAVLEALKNKNFYDFEDCLQDCCAINVNADYIVTVNKTDFDSKSVTPAIYPSELLEILS